MDLFHDTFNEQTQLCCECKYLKPNLAITYIIIHSNHTNGRSKYYIQIQSNFKTVRKHIYNSQHQLI